MSGRVPTRIRRKTLAAAAVALASALGVSGAAQAQLKPGSQQGLGLTGAAVPPLLQQIRSDPYRMPPEPVCASAAQELAQLDAIMGPDVDKLKTDRTVADRAAGYVRGMIPYHGIVRFLTGADGRDRELQAAASVGYARRGFLHGLQAQRHCEGAAETRIAAADATPVSAAAAPPPPDAHVAAAEARPAEARAIDAVSRVSDPEPRRVEAAATSAVAPQAPPHPPPPRVHLVYRLVDAATGRPIVPDEAAAPDPAPPDPGR